ncbi:Bug family tripartite tricarboxylate transporter substrate binding protein [Siccirubricoccus phaeus]|uniref:Bug family tripartite tricarboxylate transporter substrate binding protein n=1 Tax=Siccirubricoccus phaeus TaxID=2595053 RepID=UPI0011F384FE|nr:tripartite tricarboxylate transporter substrate binding protein [Siccirubricoccus phaeus]
MKKHLNCLFRLTWLVLALVAWPDAASAYPERPVRMIVGAAAGGSNDLVARLLAEGLTARLPHPVVVENRSGAAGMIGLETVARAAPDGHTLLLVNTAHAGLRVFVPNASIDPHTGVTAISVLAESPMVMLVANAFPAADLRGFVEAVRAAPGRFAYGSTGGGGTLRMGAVLFLRATGLNMTEVPYRGGGPAQLDLAAGRIAMLFDVGVTSFQTARSGLARAFAVTSAARSPAAPEVPTLRESGIDAEMTVWQAVMAPAATPRELREAVQSAIAQVLADPALRSRFAELGADRVLGLGVGESEAYLAAEVQRWETLLRASELK